jgi:hypothetical protein
MSDKQELANWLFANQDKQGTPEFKDKLTQFRAADTAPTAGKIIVPPRGETAVKILQDEFIKEYERPAGTPEEQSRREANLGALTRELATLKAQPPAVERKEAPVEEESPVLSGLRQDMGQIEKKRQEQQPEDMRLNAQIAGAAIGAVPGAVQQAAVIRDVTGRGVNSGMGRIADLVAQRMQPPAGANTISDLIDSATTSGVPGEITDAEMRRISTRFYQDHPEEIPNGLRATGGPATYAYARRSQLPQNIAEGATDQKHAARLIANLARGNEEAQAAFPNRTIIQDPRSGISTLSPENEPRSRVIIGSDRQQAPVPPPSPPQPQSALPPGQPLTGAPNPRLTAGTNPFQPGRPALLQAPPVETPMPPMSAGTPPPGMGVRREPTMGAQPGPAMLGPAALGESPRPTSATRGPIRSGLDAVTDMFARNVTEPTQRVLSALPIVTKTLGGMQTLGGGAEALTGARQGDAGKIGTGAAEMLGGGLSMFNRTAPAGMAISILTELYRNARTPEDRQKIMDALNERMFGKQEVM